MHEPTELQKRDLAERIEQHRELQLKARAIFSTIKGQPGVRSLEDFTRIMAKVTGDYETGKFLLDQLGADRFIDHENTLTLGHIRQQLLAGIARPTMGDKLAVDSAVIAYHNLLRLQAWIGNIALVVERDLFGQAPLDEIHGMTVGQKFEHLSHANASVWLEKTNRYTSQPNRKGVANATDVNPAGIRQLMERYLARVPTDDNGYLTAAAALKGVYDVVDAVKRWEGNQPLDGGEAFRIKCADLQRDYAAFHSGRSASQ